MSVTNPTGTDVYHDEIHGRHEMTQAERIWIYLPFYDDSKPRNEQGMTSAEVSEGMGMLRSSVTARLNFIEAGGLPGASLRIIIRKDAAGRTVKHYCRDWGNLPISKPSSDEYELHAWRIWNELNPYETGEMNVRKIEAYLRRHCKIKAK